MESSRILMLCLLLSILIASLAFASVPSWYAGANSFMSSTLASFIFLGAFVFLLCVKPKQPEPLSTQVPSPNVGMVEGQTTAPMVPHTRQYYLDNLKSFLTGLVVLHHVTCVFGSTDFYYGLALYNNSFQPLANSLKVLDQSFFMALFFFISGLFVPTSYDRKGARGFLKDKFKRLGLPFLGFYLFVGPLLDLFIKRCALGKPPRPYVYTPDAGPPWFIAWLLLLSTAYTLVGTRLIGGEHIECQRPSFCCLLLIGLVLGILQGILMVMIPEGSFVFMPFTIGSLPFDIAFFTGGILAKRNGWLSADLPSKVYWGSALGSMVCALISIVFMVLAYVQSTVKRPNSETSVGQLAFTSLMMMDDDKTMSTSNSAPSHWLIFFFAALCGITCSCISVAAVAVFQRKANYQTTWTKFYSDAAYTVYLIHPWIVVPLAWSYVLFLRYICNVDVTFGMNTNGSDTDLGNDAFIWLGWIYVASFSQVIVWPVAWGLRQLPGLNQIL